MKVLITGGAGFIGSHIADAYLREGHEVVIFDNLSTGKRENVNANVRFYQVDVCSPEAREIVTKERPDILSHHAAQIDVRKSVSDPLFDLRVNVGGLINLVEVGLKAGLKKVIMASSGGTVYGEQEVFPATEEHPTRPISPYGLNKLACEQYLYYYEKKSGLNWVALRYANIYGPRQNSHGEAGVVAIFAEKFLKGETPIINGDGHQTRDYVFVEDVVAANLLALNKTPSPPAGEGRGEGGRIYNVGTGVETDVNTIFRALREFTGSRCEERYGEAKAGEQIRSCLSAGRIERELGWCAAVSLPDGLRRTVEWFRSQQKRELAQ